MLKLNLPTKKVLVFTLLAMTLMSSNVFANVYKWRDSTGRTQYSDTPPATSYSIVGRSELVNALQSKDVCTVSNAKPSVIAQSKLRQFSANFDFRVLGGNPNSGFSTANQNNSPFFNFTGSGFASKAASQNIKPITTPSTLSRVSTASTVAKIPTNIASITKFVASHAMPAVVSPAPPRPVINLTPKVATSSSTTAASLTPTTVAINLPPNIVQVAQMPAVDTSKNMIPAVGFSDLRLEPTTELPQVGTDGAFRIGCAPSHMSNDDPIVYPNQPGAAHSHTFFGNTSTNAKSDLMNLNGSGNSTCNGGIMNKSGYWIPSMIDTATNTPIKPDGALVYYKAGDLGFKSNEPVTQPPKGLRMIAGNPKGLPGQGNPWDGHYTCTAPNGSTLPWSKTIPNCQVGDVLSFHVSFPQCWDGKNLDSPDHKSHMAEREYISNASIEMRCPSTHPVRIPAITLNVYYTATKANQMLNWRLASDNYPTSSPGGSSLHADWVNGWDEKLLAVVVKNCIQPKVDCHAHLIGDGRKMF